MEARLPGNLNVSFAGVDGEALLVSLDDVAVSSGAACTQAEPSHVLMALGLSKDRALASLAVRHRAGDDGGGCGLSRRGKSRDVVQAAAPAVAGLKSEVQSRT